MGTIDEVRQRHLFEFMNVQQKDNATGMKTLT